MTLGLINANPVVHAKKERFPHPHTGDAVDPLEIYDILFLPKNLFISFSLSKIGIFDWLMCTVCERYQGSGAPVLPGAAQRAL